MEEKFTKWHWVSKLCQWFKIHREFFKRKEAWSRHTILKRIRRWVIDVSRRVWEWSAKRKSQIRRVQRRNLSRIMEIQQKTRVWNLSMARFLQVLRVVFRREKVRTRKNELQKWRRVWRKLARRFTLGIRRLTEIKHKLNIKGFLEQRKTDLNT